MTSETDITKEIDTLYPKACLIVQQTGNTLISHLQRVLQIGYNRAARLLEAMETDGIVSAMDRHGVRKLLVPQPGARGVEATAHKESQNDRQWVCGYYCAVAALLREEGQVTVQVLSLFKQGGSPELADQMDRELFIAHGLLEA